MKVLSGSHQTLSVVGEREGGWTRRSHRGSGALTILLCSIRFSIWWHQYTGLLFMSFSWGHAKFFYMLLSCARSVSFLHFLLLKILVCLFLVSFFYKDWVYEEREVLGREWSLPLLCICLFVFEWGDPQGQEFKIGKTFFVKKDLVGKW